MNSRLLALTVVLGLAGFAAGTVKTQTLAPSAPLPSPGFHHIHMNSANPGAAIDTFLKVYPASTKVTVAGFEGLKTANDVHMLFTKVNTPPPAPGPDRASAAKPQTAFWHHVWAAADGRQTLKELRDHDPKFDSTRLIPQYTGPEGGTVDFSSDTFPGFLTNSQLEEATRNGERPAHRGGYFNWYGPDGVVMETTDGPTERYTIVGMFEEQPYCALFWYQKHLNAADRPATTRGGAGGGGAAGAGRGPAQASGPTSEADCQVSRGSEVSWPSTYKRGHRRIPPPQLVYFGDVTLRWYMNQEDRPLVSTRGQLMDHIALSVTNLDAWIAKLRSEGVKFLKQPYTFGDTRAVMIEGPSLEALELVESKE
jgi:hypothetical protein